MIPSFHSEWETYRKESDLDRDELQFQIQRLAFYSGALSAMNVLIGDATNTSASLVELLDRIGQISKELYEGSQASAADSEWLGHKLDEQ